MGGAAIVRRALNESPQNLFAMPVVFGAVVLTLLSIACAVVREALRIADRAPVAPTVGEPAAPRRRRSTTVAFATAAIGATRDVAPPAAAALSPRRNSSPSRCAARSSGCCCCSTCCSACPSCATAR